MQIRLINILILISSLFLCSCDPTVYYDAVLTYRIINDTEEKLIFKINYKVEDVFLKSVIELEKKEEEFVEVETFDTPDSATYSSPETIFSAMYVHNTADECLYSDTLCSNKGWKLKIKKGEEYDYDHSSAFIRHNLWYDYTFVITDSMLKK